MLRNHPMFRFLLLISLISGAVLLAFKYLLPLFLPFVVAYVLMRLLFPLIHWLRGRFHLSARLAYGGTLGIFFALLFGGLFYLGKYLIRQGQLLCTNAPVYCQICLQTVSSYCDNICLRIDHYMQIKSGSTLTFVSNRLSDFNEHSAGQIYTRASQMAFSWLGGSMQLFMFLLITFIAMIILCKDMEPLHNAYRKHKFYPAVHKVVHTMRETGLLYLKAQLIIMLINWAVCSLGFYLIRSPYFIIIGLIISLIDALPFLGSGIILIPCGFYFIFKNQFYPAAILFTVYLITLFVREILEAKLMGDGMGMLSFFTLASIYAGLKFYGICGIFLGPFSIVLIRAIYQVWNDSTL